MGFPCLKNLQALVYLPLFFQMQWDTEIQQDIFDKDLFIYLLIHISSKIKEFLSILVFHRKLFLCLTGQ